MKKFCRGCFELKDIEEFYAKKDIKGGRQSYCISCAKEKQRAYMKEYQRRKRGFYDV